MAIGASFPRVAMNQNKSDPKMNRTSEVDSTPPSNQGLSATTSDHPAFGWSGYAERINGRFAMIGFSAVLITEVFSHDTFLHWAGLIP